MCVLYYQNVLKLLKINHWSCNNSISISRLRCNLVENEISRKLESLFWGQKPTMEQARGKFRQTHWTVFQSGPVSIQTNCPSNFAKCSHFQSYHSCLSCLYLAFRNKALLSTWKKRKFGKTHLTNKYYKAQIVVNLFRGKETYDWAIWNWTRRLFI